MNVFVDLPPPSDSSGIARAFVIDVRQVKYVQMAMEAGDVLAPLRLVSRVTRLMENYPGRLSGQVEEVLYQACEEHFAKVPEIADHPLDKIRMTKDGRDISQTYILKTVQDFSDFHCTETGLRIAQDSEKRIIALQKPVARYIARQLSK